MAAEATDQEILASLNEEPAAPTEGAPPESAAPAATEAPSWNRQEWEFEQNGRKFSPESREQAMTWMGQGRSFSQRQFEHNQAVKAWETKRAAEEAKYKGFDKYREIDEYARGNKGWWDHIQKSYETRGQGAQAEGVPDFSQVLAPIQSELQELRVWREQQLEAARQQDLQRADQALSEEIESIRESHANIDFDSVDESGKSLEQRVLDHCTQIGTSSFRAGFRDYYHDKLVESRKAAALGAQAKAPEVAAKKGILGVSQVPKKGTDAPVNTRGMTWEQLNDLAKAELRGATN